MCEGNGMRVLEVSIDVLDPLSALLGASRVKIYNLIEEADEIGVKAVVLLEGLEEMLQNAVDAREVHEHKIICMVPCKDGETVGRIEIERCADPDCKKTKW